MPLTIFSSARFADHVTPPGHPERSERAQVFQAIAAAFRASGGEVCEPRALGVDGLGRVHLAEHISRIRETAGRAVRLDPDTVTSPESFDVARLAAGAAVEAVDRVLDGPRGSRALALVRPPGHHAEPARAMGFCLFNNVAVAAAHARARGVPRVAIVDYDVHHGNGTQAAFFTDPSVLFISLHQFPYYPGTGAADEIGSGGGRGFTVNLPMAAGAGNADYEAAFHAVVLPCLRQFHPELLLVSAGFDAHEDDPLGGMRLTSGQFGRLTALLTAVADMECAGRVAAVTEGGYDLKGLADSVSAVVRVLAGHAGTDDFDEPAGPTGRGEAAAAAARSHLAPYWRIA